VRQSRDALYTMHDSERYRVEDRAEYLVRVVFGPIRNSRPHQSLKKASAPSKARPRPPLLDASGLNPILNSTLLRIRHPPPTYTSTHPHTHTSHTVAMPNPKASTLEELSER
jgi:hypothetical protein